MTTLTGCEDLETLRKIKEAAEKLVQEDPSEKHQRAFQLASENLAAAEGKGAKEEPSYTNGAEALRALQAKSFKVSRSKFYRHCKQGVCQVEKDGSILESSVARYIRHPRSNLVASKDADMVIERQSRKAAQELKKLEHETRLLELKRLEKEGALIDRQEFYVQYAGLTEMIYQQLRNCIYMTAARRCEKILKDPENSTDALIRADLKNLDRTFNELAAVDKFAVRFIWDEEGDATGDNE